MAERPYISIIVSVYNSEKTLASCIESLVYQTLDNIEIIIVDKASTDRSKAIAEEYQVAFSEKVHVYHRPYSMNLSAAYNFAIPLAKAEYVAFSDADDRYDLSAMKTLYEHISKKPTDIVRYFWRVYDPTSNKEIRIGRVNGEETIEAQLSSTDMCAFWSCLFKKDFLVKHLPVPEVAGPDANFIPAAISKAASISVVNKPLYYYMAGIGITSNRFSSDLLSVPDGWDYLLDHCNHKYVDYIAAFIATRVRSCIGVYWAYKWEYVAWLKKRSEYFLNNTILMQNMRLFQFICTNIEEESELIPCIAYINGFGGQDTEQIRNGIQNQAFQLGIGGYRIVILDETTCNLAENEHLQKAYQEGQYEYLGHYFALKGIFNTGGFYVGKHIRFTASLAPVLDKPSIFSYITTNTFSSEIWGSRSKNKVIQTLLQTYENPNFYQDPYYPLSDRIRNVLVACFDIPLNGYTTSQKDVFVADANTFVLNTGQGQFVCEHDFSEFAQKEGYRVVPINVALAHYSANNLNKLTQERNRLKQQLNGIYQSDSWKLIKRLKRFANSRLGRPFKKIFKFAVRHYRRIKYGM